jgi:NADPH:quinone reductase-like Zn-dependent oxidoreductase
MRAAVITGLGGIDRITLAELPTPAPRDGEVRVRVRAASINHLDIWVRTQRAAGPFPHVLGSDASGAVDAIGAGVAGLSPGDEVVLHPAIGCGACVSCLRGEVSLCDAFRLVGAATPGVYAEYACAPQECWFPKPPSLSFEEAACLGVNFVTAWRMVVSRAQVRPGMTVLVTGIGGGVAIAAMQIALLAGARVLVTSSSAQKLERARSLGASEGIDYRREDVAARARALTGGAGVDVVIDSAGEAAYASNLAALRKGGRLVNCGITTGFNPPADIRQIYARQLEVIGSTMGSRADFAEVLRLAGAGRLHPIVDSVFALEDIALATRKLEAGEQFGKLVLRIDG